MSRSPSRRSSLAAQLSDSFSQIYAEHSSVLIGMAFDFGMMLGQRTQGTAVGRKIRNGVAEAAEHVITLAPQAVAKLVPDQIPGKSRRRRRKSSAKHVRS